MDQHNKRKAFESSVGGLFESFEKDSKKVMKSMKDMPAWEANNFHNMVIARKLGEDPQVQMEDRFERREVEAGGKWVKGMMEAWENGTEGVHGEYDMEGLEKFLKTAKSNEIAVSAFGNSAGTWKNLDPLKEKEEEFPIRVQGATTVGEQKQIVRSIENVVGATFDAFVGSNHDKENPFLSVVQKIDENYEQVSHMMKKRTFVELLNKRFESAAFVLRNLQVNEDKGE